MLGVFGALVATFANLSITTMAIAAGLVLLFGIAGVAVGFKVSPIQLPQTVAAFHSLVGLAAMLTSIGSFVATPSGGFGMENVAAVLGDFIGGVTLTGSIIAFLKLNGNMGSKPLNLPGKNYLNLFGLFLFIGLSASFLNMEGQNAIYILFGVACLAMLMGWHLVGSV